MFTAKIVLIYLFVHLTILTRHVDYVFASPCSRVPQGTGAGKSDTKGNFGIRLSGDSNFYTPGRQYTGKKKIS